MNPPAGGECLFMTACRDFQRTHCSRRALVSLGALGLGGLWLPDILRAEATSSEGTRGGRSGTPRKAKARSCVLLFQFGGPSQFETFDPKPQAPAEIRGEFGTI